MALSDGLRLLAASTAKSSAQREAAWFEWATVDALSPLAVRLDSDETGTPREVSGNSFGAVDAEQRVWVCHQGRRLTIANAPRPHPRILAGAVSLGQHSGSETTVSTTVLFSGAFTAAPRVTMSINHAAGGSHALTVRPTAVSATGMTVVFLRTDGGSLNGQWLEANWIAVQA